MERIVNYVPVVVLEALHESLLIDLQPHNWVSTNYKKALGDSETPTNAEIERHRTRPKQCGVTNAERMNEARERDIDKHIAARVAFPPSAQPPLPPWPLGLLDSCPFSNTEFSGFLSAFIAASVPHVSGLGPVGPSKSFPATMIKAIFYSKFDTQEGPSTSQLIRSHC